MEELTEDQKKKLEALSKEARKIGTKLGLKSALLIFGMCLAIMIVNVFFVQSEYFVFFGALVSGICGISMAKEDMKNAEIEIIKKTEDIINNP